MPFIYTAFEELSWFCGQDGAKEIYDFVKNKYPNRDSEELVNSNIEHAKISEKSRNGLLAYMLEAIKNDYAGQEKNIENCQGKTAFEELVDLFCIENIAKEIYDFVKNKYQNYDYEELILENIKYAKTKQKKIRIKFLQFSREVIENNHVGYNTK